MRASDLIAHGKLTCSDSLVGTRVDSPEKAHSIFMPLMLTDRETLVVMCLDQSRSLISAFVAGIGTADMVQVDTQQMFRAAILLGASYILIAHNHPSGDPTPSNADIQTTINLELCAKILGIGFVDHLVLTTSGCYRSIAEYVETYGTSNPNSAR